MDLALKSTASTSSVRVSMEAESYHSRGRHWILVGSVIRALESLVRSIIRSGSLEIMVIWPGYLSSRRAWTRPRVPLPLFGVSEGSYMGKRHVTGQKHEVDAFKEHVYTYRCIDLPANNNHLLLRLLHTAFNDGIALTELDIFFFGIDVDSAISLGELVFV